MLLGLQDWQYYGIINKGSFRPNNIADLQLWLDANDASTLFQDAAKTTPAGNGDVVGAWADKSGQSNDATQTTTSQKPTRQDGIINGLPVVRGDTDDEMVISLTLTNETIFVVCNHAVTDAFGGIIAGPVSRRITFTGGLNDAQYRYNNTTINIGTFNELNFNLYRFIFNGTNHTISVNNGVASSGTPVAAAQTYTRLFSLSGSSFLNGDVAEYIVYNRALNTGEIGQINTYLSSKYGITIA